MSKATSVLAELLAAGASIEATNGELLVDAEPGNVTQEMLRVLAENKAEVILMIKKIGAFYGDVEGGGAEPAVPGVTRARGRITTATRQARRERKNREYGRCTRQQTPGTFPTNAGYQQNHFGPMLRAGDFLQTEILTIEDVMRIAQISQTTALRWVKGTLPSTTQLPAVRIGRQWRIQKSILMQHLGLTEPEIPGTRPVNLPLPPSALKCSACIR